MAAMITIREETMAVLGEYAKVSIAFTVKSRYVPVPVEGAAKEWNLIELPVDPPWIKDYDAGESPTRWLRWDTSDWRIVSAFVNDERVGRRDPISSKDETTSRRCGISASHRNGEAKASVPSCSNEWWATPRTSDALNSRSKPKM